MSVNIKHVAKEAKVSVATVSNYLNNKLHKMHPRTARRIAEVIEELGYRPSIAARNVGRRRTGTIGIIAPGKWIKANLVTSEILCAISSVAFQHGFNISLVEDSNEGMIEELASKQRVDGIVLLYTLIGDNMVPKLLKTSLPFVLLNRCHEDPRVNYVHADNAKGTYLATKHLMEQGYERIVYLGTASQLPINDERYAGYQTAMATWGDQGRALRITYREELLAEFCRGPGPHGFVCYNDSLALRVMNWAIRQGLKIPEDVGIVGFDNSAVTEWVYPRLSSVKCPFYAMAEQACKLLISLIQQEEPKQTKFLFDTGIVVRDSSMRNKAVASSSGQENGELGG